MHDIHLPKIELAAEKLISKALAGGRAGSWKVHWCNREQEGRSTNAAFAEQICPPLTSPNRQDSRMQRQTRSESWQSSFAANAVP